MKTILRNSLSVLRRFKMAAFLNVTGLAWVLFVIILGLTFIVNWTKKYWVYSE